MWNWIKGLWESNKSKLIKQICKLLEMLEPVIAGKIFDAGKGKISLETAQASANDIVTFLQDYIKKQL